MDSDFTKLARVYIDRNFTRDATVMLGETQGHYLKNVLRMKPGEHIRLFNGRDGEWLGEIKEFNRTEAAVMLQEKIREQPPAPAEMHLLFAPIKKKDRLDFLIEKAVELGATDIHPVLTHRTEARKINEERLKAQILEAAEQCERFELPRLHPVMELKPKIAAWNFDIPILWCRERGESPPISQVREEKWAFLIGPEGGFDDNEFAFLGGLPRVYPITLGETVLRAETAVILALGYAKIQGL